MIDSKSVIINNITISKHIVMLLISAFVTLFIALYSTRKYRKDINKKPNGLSQIFEILMDFINNEIVIPNIGKNYARTWTPVAMTFFVFILITNLLGLIPLAGLWLLVLYLTPGNTGANNYGAPSS